MFDNLSGGKIGGCSGCRDRDGFALKVCHGFYFRTHNQRQRGLHADRSKHFDGHSEHGGAHRGVGGSRVAELTSEQSGDVHVAGDTDELYIEPLLTELPELAADERGKMTHRRGRVAERDELELRLRGARQESEGNGKKDERDW